MITGSIPKAPAASKDGRLSAALGTEDWRRAQAAIATALDPQGNGAEVSWSNPESGMRGAIIPSSLPYPKDGRACRAFSAKIDGEKTHEDLDGVACRQTALSWTIESATQKKAH